MRSHPHTPAAPLPPLLNRFTTTYLPNQDPPSSDRRRRRARSVDLGADDFGGKSRSSSSSSSSSDFGVLLADCDPDTSRLLQPPPPPPRKRSTLPHHVRIQGQLALVRSVSVANLRHPPNTPTTPGPLSPAARPETGVGGGGSRSCSDLGSKLRVRETLPSRQVVGGQRITSSTTKGKRSRRRKSLEIEGHGEEGEEGGGGDLMVQERDTQLRSYGIGGAGNIRRATDVIGTSTRTSSLNALFSSPSSSTPNALVTPYTSDWRKWNLGDYFSRLNDRKGKSRAALGT